MSAAREEFLMRSLVAGVASTVVLSLTALTVGVAPAIADPSSAETTTVEVPEPETVYEQPTAEATVERTSEPVVEVTTPTVAPVPEAPVVEVPVFTQTAEPEPEPVVTPTAEPAPEPVVTKPAPPSTTAAPAPRTQAPVTSSTVTSSTSAPSTVAPSAPRSTTVAPAPAAEPAAEPTETAKPTPTERPVRAAETTTDKPAEVAAETSAESTETAQPTETSESATPAESSEPSETEQPAEPSASVESSEVEKTAAVIETLKPDTLAAPAADVELARIAAPVEVKPEPARVDELAQLSSLIGVERERDRLDDERRDLREDQQQLREDQRQLREDQRELRAEQRDWDRRVRQWNPDWVQYDEFYRPMIVNPYRDPVRIVYEYENRPRVVTIPPLQRMVMYVADLAAYSFTAVVLNTINTVVSTAVGVAVGSFFGGGFIPNIANINAIAPPPPPPLYRYDNVPVQVRYSDAVYEPFRVQRIVDVGDDARYGERRVLLDGVTPAWGVWKQSAGGERLFEVHRTQQYPGLDEPREAPLPGDYRLRLAAEAAPETGGDNQTLLITAAVACAVLSLGAVGGAALMGRRRV